MRDVGGWCRDPGKLQDFCTILKKSLRVRSPPELEFTHPLASFQKWPWLYPPSTPHCTRTRAAHLPHPLPREFVCGACIGTAQIGASLVAPIGFILKRCSRNQWACTRLLVGKLGHTGLVPFVDEFGTVCGKVPLEYGFAVIV